LKKYNRARIADCRLLVIKTVETARRKIGNWQSEIGNVSSVWRLDAKSSIIKL
jgi:hypothetical protein